MAKRRARRSLAAGVWLAVGLVLLTIFAPLRARADGDVYMNERLQVPGDGLAHVYTFIPTANNLYTIRSFGEGAARAELYLEGEEEPVARAEGFSMDVRLIADATYRLAVTSEAPVEVEMMRCALGRSIDEPLELGALGAGYDKVIARAYDTHWYRFTAPVSGIYVIRSQSNLNTVGYLLDEAGRKLALSDNLYSPYDLDFRIAYRMEAGRTYIVRVSGRGGETGQYHLVIAVPTPGAVAPSAIEMSEEALSLAEGDTAALSCRVMPGDAVPDVVWVSADPRVASVDQEGRVTAHAAGDTRIIASGVGADGACRVSVAPIAVTGIELALEELALRQGETETLEYAVLPANASDQGARFTSADESVISVQPGGLLAAVGQGETTVTVTSDDGSYTDDIRVIVLPARSRYRALLLGLQRFDDGDVRLGAVNTTQGIYDLLARQVVDGGGIETEMRLDMTREEAVSAIRETFADAESGDVSILYINSHGGLSGRTPWIRFSDGAVMTAHALEKELRAVKGRVVLLLDCCGSGSFISTGTRRLFGDRVIEAFSSGSSGRLASSKYCVLASAAATQDSYRLLPVKNANENNSSTAFARSLCEAGGWDLIGDKPMRYRADIDQDHRVTLFEAYLYCQRRVRAFLKGQRVAQDVQLWPMGSQLVLFEHE